MTNLASIDFCTVFNSERSVQRKIYEYAYENVALKQKRIRPVIKFQCKWGDDIELGSNNEEKLTKELNVV